MPAQAQGTKHMRLFGHLFAAWLWITGAYLLFCLARIVLHYAEHGVH